jgi:pectate lyase
LEERVGFGREARGGQGGALCVVTRLDDDLAAGSLRACLDLPGPRWVRFEASGVLSLASPLVVPSFTTLDGRGANVTLTGQPVVLNGAEHVILHNLALRDGVLENRDLLEVQASIHVWLDRLTLRRSVDELLGVVEGSRAVTVSRCVFEDQEQASGILIGNDAASPGDEVQEVTLHHNWFRFVRSNLPRLRFGKVHAFNNFYESWESEPLWVTMGGQLASERNVFMAPSPLAAVARTTREAEEEGFVRSTDDLLLFATFTPNGEDRVFDPADLYPYEPDNTLALPERVRLTAGRRDEPFPE